MSHGTLQFLTHLLHRVTRGFVCTFDAISFRAEPRILLKLSPRRGSVYPRLYRVIPNFPSELRVSALVWSSAEPCPSVTHSFGSELHCLGIRSWWWWWWRGWGACDRDTETCGVRLLIPPPPTPGLPSVAPPCAAIPQSRPSGGVGNTSWRLWGRKEEEMM